MTLFPVELHHIGNGTDETHGEISIMKERKSSSLIYILFKKWAILYTSYKRLDTYCHEYHNEDGDKVTNEDMQEDILPFYFYISKSSFTFYRFDLGLDESGINIKFLQDVEILREFVCWIKDWARD